MKHLSIELPQKRATKSRRSFLLYGFLLVALWTIAVGTSLWHNIRIADEQALSIPRMQADTALSFASTYHSWTAEIGSVYAKKSPYIMPNPYITPEMNQSLPDGSTLVLITPNHMLRSVTTLKPSATGITVQSKSANPLSPENMADAWEKTILTLVPQHSLGSTKTPIHYENAETEKTFRMLLPLYAQKSCLACHAQPTSARLGDSGSSQTIKEGTLLGSLSVSVPMDTSVATALFNAQGLIGTHCALWILGLASMVLGGSHIRRGIEERNKAEAALHSLAENLETRVTERTKDLRNSQKRFQDFLNNTDAGVFVKDTDLRYTLTNNTFSHIFTVTQDAIIGKKDEDIIPADLATQLEELQKNTLRKNQITEIEFLHPTNGLTYSYSSFPVTGAEGEAEGLGGMIVDITQRKNVEDTLRQAKEVAESASQAKSDFLANISHEIRTPLNGIIGMADMLLRTTLNPDQASMAATVKTAGDSLLAVLNDVLDFSKIEAGKMHLEAIPFNLRDVLFDAVKSLAPIAHQKKLELIVHISPPVPNHLIGDPVRIRQILLNLINNALKFTEQGEISLTVQLQSLKPSHALLRFTTTDTGIGISQEKQQTIFAAFEQADSSTTRKYGGTGLGLAISTKLAYLMNSQLHLISHQGVGSTFWFDLELPYTEEQSPPHPKISAQALKGIRALVVDDNQTNRHILMETLPTWGIDAQESASTDEALSLLSLTANAGRPFNLVLSDLQMPEKDGLDLIKAMRANPKLSAIPVILLSSGNLPDDAHINPLYHANLNKPVRPEELMKAMASALGIWESIDSQQIKKDADLDTIQPFAKSLNILLVEDMEMNQFVTTRMLVDLGHKSKIASNGQEAVDLIAQEQFDLVLMDIQMPVMDGVQATHILREREKANPNHPPLPIVAMTAHALKGDRERYLAEGMDNYLSKPILLTDLASMLEWVVRNFYASSEKEGAMIELVDFEKDQETNPIDFSIIQGSFGNNKELAAKSMQLYCRDAPKLLQEIENAASREDNSALIVNAHALKGISSYYSRESTFKTAQTLEMLGRADALPTQKKDVLLHISNLRQQVNIMLYHMEKYIASNASREPRT